MVTANHRDAAPPQPRSVLRGHKAPVHAAVFLRSNERLLTGDADGFVVSWDLTIMRPCAVWQAHDNAILGIAAWGMRNIITHGRDNRLIVWQLSADDEPAMSTTLPLDPAPVPRPKPWMLHFLEVNTMNFCSFASFPASTSMPVQAPSLPRDSSDLLIAVPNTLASEAVDIYHLPSQKRIHVVKLGSDHGMAMALALVWLSGILTLIVAYEDGTAIVTKLENNGSWLEVYRSQCHKQPVLSLGIAPNLEYFFTSSADATIAKHPLLPRESSFASFIEPGPKAAPPGGKQYFQFVPGDGAPDQDTSENKSESLLSAALASQPTGPSSTGALNPKIQTKPLKIVNTKHSGQQGLNVRSDGRVFATAGWDSRIRVYSAKSMQEVAVLRWHPVGCFAVAFADVCVTDVADVQPTAVQSNDKEQSADTSLFSKVFENTVKNKRLSQVKNTHWLAAGSKDGKVSLWDVF